MLPPYYYKGVSDDGLFASYAEVIERVGDPALRIYLYHIPPVSQVGLSLDLIGRLLSAYPDVIAGLKDSGGDWNNTRVVLREYPTLATFCGSEVFLLETLRHGGAGSITATANINPAQIRELYSRWQKDDANDLQTRITAVRAAYASYPTVPALKAVAAEFYDSPDWRGVRPPLCPLDTKDARKLMNALEAAGFSMHRDST
jgi:4-hydroxy-tetrahydrodipicolinate synthase